MKQLNVNISSILVNISMNGVHRQKLKQFIGEKDYEIVKNIMWKSYFR